MILCVTARLPRCKKKHPDDQMAGFILLLSAYRVSAVSLRMTAPGQEVAKEEMPL